MSPSTTPVLPEEYADWLNPIERQYRPTSAAHQVGGQGRANADVSPPRRRDLPTSANPELGTKLIECLPCDLSEVFPEICVFSSRNPKKMEFTVAFARFPEILGRGLPSIAEIQAELAGELNTGSKVE